MDGKELQRQGTIPEVSQNLIKCILAAETDKLGFYRLISDELYRADGQPNFLMHFKRPSISFLRARAEEKDLLKVIYVIVSDFCAALNVSQNMSKDQIVETCYWLLTDSRGFWIEDYVLMLDMAKKGQLLKIYNRIDRQVISEIREAYWEVRHNFMSERYRDWYNKISPEGREDYETRTDKDKMNSGLSKLEGIIGEVKNKLSGNDKG